MIPRQIIIDLVEGDTSPPLVTRFLGLDLRNYTTIKLHVLTPHNRRFSRDVVPDGVDFELGLVFWQAGDLIRGRSLAEFEFQNAQGRFTLPQKRPIFLDVRSDLV